MKSVSSYMLILLMIVCTVCSIAADTVHVVKKGETLYGISRFYQVPLSELTNINKITDASKVKPGMELIIPGIPVVYMAQKGDTLYGIARMYGISLEELKTYNKWEDSRQLRVGDTIRIPGTAKANAVTKAEEPKKSDPVPPKQDVAVSREKNAGDASSSDPGVPFWPVAGQRISLDGKLQGTAILGGHGDSVVSVSSGTVVWVGPYRGFGKVVFVETASGYIYVYGGNEKITVQVGEKLKPGIEIGKLGSKEGNPKLFFFVYKSGKPVDPQTAPRG